MIRAFALVSLCASSVAAAAPPAPSPWSVEIGGGLAICGPRGDVTCDGAALGTDLELRFGKRLGAHLDVTLGATHVSLPVDGFDAGSLWILGPEVAGVLPVDEVVDLHAGLRIAAHHVAGVFGSGWGLGTVDLRLGGRYLFGAGASPGTRRRWAAGLDYALTRPARTESCRQDVCGDADLALLHRVSVVVGLRFW